jgi:hypothetical protein
MICHCLWRLFSTQPCLNSFEFSVHFYCHFGDSGPIIQLFEFCFCLMFSSHCSPELELLLTYWILNLWNTYLWPKQEASVLGLLIHYCWTTSLTIQMSLSLLFELFCRASAATFLKIKTQIYSKLSAKANCVKLWILWPYQYTSSHLKQIMISLAIERHAGTHERTLVQKESSETGATKLWNHPVYILYILYIPLPRKGQWVNLNLELYENQHFSFSYLWLGARFL